VIGGSAAQGVLLTVLGGVPLFLVAATLTGQIFHASELRPFAYLALACAGVIHFLYGRYCMYRAYELIGANRSAPISQATTVLAVLIAVGFLNEQVTLTMGLGITFVIIGSAITAGDCLVPVRMVMRASVALSSFLDTRGLLWGRWDSEQAPC